MDHLFHRSPETAADPATDAELQPLRVYTHDLVVAGHVRATEERMTDILQRGDELAFLPDGADASDPSAWMALVPKSVLILVPPPHVSPPEKRLHRQTQRVVIRIGPYVVTGTAHLRPGYEQDLFLRATQPFLPLTDAVITSEVAQIADDVVIVNLGEMEELRQA